MGTNQVAWMKSKQERTLQLGLNSTLSDILLDLRFTTHLTDGTEWMCAAAAAVIVQNMVPATYVSSCRC
jgi:hypothetical protein